jgi:hypothetical protein
MDRPLWGTDSAPSLPEPPNLPILVDLGGTGFAFTAGGIAHNVSQADLEQYQSPDFAPLPSPGGGAPR